MSITPTALVVGAPRPPLPYGLFSVLAPREGSADRWESGVDVESIGCPPTHSALPAFECDPEPDAEDGLPYLIESHTSFSAWFPFTVFETEKCSPIPGGLSRSAEVAAARLALFEEELVEEQLFLSFYNLPNAVVALTFEEPFDKDDFITVFADAEHRIASYYGTQGIIHLPRRLASLALAFGVLEVKQSRLYTLLGTPVVAGTGYADGNVGFWSPQIVAYRSPVSVLGEAPASFFDTRQNDSKAVVSRQWLFAYDGDCLVLPEPEPDPGP